jgi:predicted metal-dependent peptidase
LLKVALNTINQTINLLVQQLVNTEILLKVALSTINLDHRSILWTFLATFFSFFKKSIFKLQERKKWINRALQEYLEGLWSQI